MIHLDANLLIAIVRPTDFHYARGRRVISGPGPFGCSAVAWMEFHSKPVHPRDITVTQSILSTGSKRRTRLDTMIAASAILAGAELATTNRDDFSVFIPHGLRLHPVD